MSSANVFDPWPATKISAPKRLGIKLGKRRKARREAATLNFEAKTQSHLHHKEYALDLEVFSFKSESQSDLHHKASPRMMLAGRVAEGGGGGVVVFVDCCQLALRHRFRHAGHHSTPPGRDLRKNRFACGSCDLSLFSWIFYFSRKRKTRFSGTD